MKRFPMMLQLALILFCVMAIPTATLTWYSGAQILGNSEHAIAESALAGLNANRNLNENTLYILAQNTIRLAATHFFERSALTKPLRKSIRITKMSLTHYPYSKI